MIIFLSPIFVGAIVLALLKVEPSTLRKCLLAVSILGLAVGGVEMFTTGYAVSRADAEQPLSGIANLAAHSLTLSLLTMAFFSVALAIVAIGKGKRQASSA